MYVVSALPVRTLSYEIIIDLQVYILMFMSRQGFKNFSFSNTVFSKDALGELFGQVEKPEKL